MNKKDMGQDHCNNWIKDSKTEMMETFTSKAEDFTSYVGEIQDVAKQLSKKITPIHSKLHAFDRKLTSFFLQLEKECIVVHKKTLKKVTSIEEHKFFMAIINKMRNQHE